jgi:hypothetical protein
LTAVHWREETWLQASGLVAAAGQPTSRNMGCRYAEHRRSGQSWSEVDVEHRRPTTAALLFGQVLFLMLSYISLNRCLGSEG